MSRSSAPTAAQQAALHPAASVWVAASAGTGKTRVLTDRLLALMLAGTDPARILCLTFTRAAAAEMANRINQRLAAWTTLPPGRLEEELVALTGQFPQEHQTARARQLFAEILDVPGGSPPDSRQYSRAAGCPLNPSKFPSRTIAPSSGSCTATAFSISRFCGSDPVL